jgi:hypothetical protein
MTDMREGAFSAAGGDVGFCSMLGPFLFTRYAGWL